jgi:AcrR family transcriptional regulator
MELKNTTARLLEAAEHNFAEYGYAGTSLRRVMQEAGADSGAVYYHFRTKEALFQAVLRRRVGEVNVRRAALLDELERAPAPRVEDVLDAFLRPSFEFAAHPRYGKHWRRLMAWYRVEKGGHWPRTRESYGDLIPRVLAALARALPHYRERTLREGLFMAIGLAVNYLVDMRSRQALNVGLQRGPLGSEYQRVLSFCAAGIRALSAHTKEGKHV